MGSRPGAHICGKTSPIWSDLADAGLFSFSIDNCEDLEAAKREVGDRMRFAGNVPPIEVMKDGSIDDVIEACKDCLRKCGDNPKGYIFEYRNVSFRSVHRREMLRHSSMRQENTVMVRS